jgi:hypothetical protein
MLQEHALAVALGPRVQHMVSKRFARFLKQWYDAVVLVRRTRTSALRQWIS